MIIHKQVRMDDYDLDIKVSSLTLHGHAFLVDHRIEIEIEVSRIQRLLIEKIDQHRRRYERYSSEDEAGV